MKKDKENLMHVHVMRKHESVLRPVGRIIELLGDHRCSSKFSDPIGWMVRLGYSLNSERSKSDSVVVQDRGGPSGGGGGGATPQTKGGRGKIVYTRDDVYHEVSVAS